MNLTWPFLVAKVSSKPGFVNLENLSKKEGLLGRDHLSYRLKPICADLDGALKPEITPLMPIPADTSS